MVSQAEHIQLRSAQFLLFRETFLPNIALLALLGIVYSTIQPIILGLAAVAFVLLFLVFKYLLIYSMDQPVRPDVCL